MHPRRLFARTLRSTFVVDVQADGRATVQHVGEGPEAAVPEQPAPPVETVAHYLGHGRIHLAADGRRTLAWAVDAGDARWVFLDGDVLQVDIDDRPAPRPRRARATGPESLGAPMPATVVRVLVVPGQSVQRGDALLLLEAMKMELPLRAPHDAVVRAVQCTEGDLVQPGVPLVDLEGA